MVFEQYSAPAIAAQPARLLADWLRAYVGLVSRWRVDYFERTGRQPQRPILSPRRTSQMLLKKYVPEWRQLVTVQK
jgi:hypothetical protein